MTLERAKWWLDRMRLQKLFLAVVMLFAIIVCLIFVAKGRTKDSVFAFFFLVPPVIGILVALWLQEALTFWITAPLRRAATSELIEAGETWERDALREVAEELIHRARTKDRMAKNYLYGRPYSHLPDAYGNKVKRWNPGIFPSRADRPERVLVMRAGGIFRTLTATSTKAWKWRRLSGGVLMLLAFPLDDVLRTLKKTEHDWWARNVGMIIWFGAYYLFAAPPGFNAEDFKSVSTRQLVLIYVNRTAGLNRGAMEVLKTRAKVDEEAKAACLRLGLILRDSKLEAKLREASWF